MIIFEKVTYQNFLSAGENPIEINLNECYSTLIVGENGSGKSQLLDALSFVLFNKPHRKINKPQLLNSINQKNCLVQLWFSIGPIRYLIKRGLKPNIFEIWQNDILINQAADVRDYQKFLETNILKLNHKSFHQVVVLGSGNFTPFMQLPTHARRSVIEDLLDIDVFTKMNIILKERVAKHKDTLKDTEHRLNLVTEKIRLQQKHIDNLKQLDKSNAEKYQSEIDDLNVQCNELTDEIKYQLSEFNRRHSTVKSNIDKNEKTLSSLKGFEQQIKLNIKRQVEDAKFYENNLVCPTCSQNITEETKNEKLHVCKDKAIELDKGFTEIKESISNVQSVLATLQDEMRELLEIQSKISSNQSIIRSHENRIKFLTSELKKGSETIDVEGAKKELDDLRDDKEGLNNLKIQQMEDRTYNDVIAELLKDTGIKTKIIRQYLPVMNKLINQYLNILDFFVSFELDDNFNETIRSRHRDEFTYASFSEGEKSRIDLSLMFAWRQIAKMKNSANTNLLILDEVFDGSLDSNGADNLLKILGTLDEQARVFVISHKQDILEGKFDRKLEIEKVKNFSRVKEE